MKYKLNNYERERIYNAILYLKQQIKINDNEEVKSIIKDLDEVIDSINIERAYLVKNSSGRYVAGKKEYSCGSSIEFFYKGGDMKKGIIEYHNEEYVIIGDDKEIYKIYENLEVLY